MRNHYFIVPFLVLCTIIQGNVYGAEDDVSGPGIVVTVATGQQRSIAATAAESDAGSALVITGTNQSATFTVNTANLESDVTITVPTGFEVSPATLSADSRDAQVTVTLKSTLTTTKGQIVLRSGDIRTYVNVTGYGTPLVQKDISQNPAYAGGDDETFAVTQAQGFAPANGYTLEFKVTTDNLNKQFYPFAVTSKGIGFKAYVNSAAMGVYNSIYQKGISNPVTSVTGGSGAFYNDDKAHTYRFSVTPDNRIFVYRDGLAIDTLRTADLGLQSDFAIENGEPTENLLKNGTFEGEFDVRSSDNLTYRIEGWDVSPLDQYNSTQNIANQEISNNQDFNNHVLEVRRYMWSDGWGAAEISQIVDVAPNETYSFSALAKGGIKKDGTILGSLKIQEVQDNALGNKVAVTSSNFQTYSMDYTTSANCKQVRVIAYLERDKWGASISALTLDDAKLTGVKRVIDQKIGFENNFAGVEYFNYDATGTYAPFLPTIGHVTGIDDVAVDKDNLFGYISEGKLYLNNVSQSANVMLYNSLGLFVLNTTNYQPGTGIPLKARGVYICVINDGLQKRTLKIVY